MSDEQLTQWEDLTPAERLRAARWSARLSQRELAGRAGIGQLAVCRAEQGRTMPHRRTWEKLAEALEVTASFLRDGVEWGR